MRAVRALVLSSLDNRRVTPVVKKALTDSGIETINLEETAAAGAIWASAVSDAIHDADLVIADLSDQNSNVMFELGIAHALRKPTIILARRDTHSKIPSDLAGFTYLLYDPNNPSELARELRHWTSLTARFS
jgi:hypothetical protein